MKNLPRYNNNDGMVKHLKKSLYGLKQARQKWMTHSSVHSLTWAFMLATQTLACFMCAQESIPPSLLSMWTIVPLPAGRVSFCKTLNERLMCNTPSPIWGQFTASGKPTFYFIVLYHAFSCFSKQGKSTTKVILPTFQNAWESG